MKIAAAVAVFFLIYSLPDVIDWVKSFKKCDKCKRRFNKKLISGQYNSAWYECKCGGAN